MAESVEVTSIKDAPPGWTRKQAFQQYRGKRERFWLFTLQRPFGNAAWLLQVRAKAKEASPAKPKPNTAAQPADPEEILELLDRMARDLGALASERLEAEDLRTAQRLERLEQRFSGSGVTEGEARNALRLFERELSKANWTEEKFAKLKRQLAGTEEWSAADLVVESSVRWVQPGKRRQAWFADACERCATPLGVEFGYTSNGGCCFVGPLSSSLGAALTTALVCHLGQLDLDTAMKKKRTLSGPQFLQGFVDTRLQNFGGLGDPWT
ncbi:unnamed protein product [Effrenium voratum]|uniref:Uncharacterized protein n=1 Tax=Effrenium voratum TaxID=2562239 RepID=A0AA36MQK9_9DINO|nr:unnamed protein product [Effrenium voratum]